jgi:hypothetical protein
MPAVKLREMTLALSGHRLIDGPAIFAIQGNLWADEKKIDEAGARGIIPATNG